MNWKKNRFILGFVIMLFYGSLLLHSYNHFLKIYKNHIEVEVEVLVKKSFPKNSHYLNFEYNHKPYSVNTSDKLFYTVQEGDMVILYYNKNFDEFIDPNIRHVPQLLGVAFFYLLAVFCLYKFISYHS